MTALAPLPDTAPPDAAGDDEGDHLYCCDPDRSLCGLDISDYSDRTGEPLEDGDVCPWCEAVYRLGGPCGPGCERRS